MQVHNRGNNTIDKKGWLKGIILVIAWLLIFSLAKDVWQLRKGFERIDQAKLRLIEEQKNNEMLKDKLAKVMTEEYKERIIREQLNMQKVGEVVVVLPKKVEFEKGESGSEEEAQENWEKWWALLK